MQSTIDDECTKGCKTSAIRVFLFCFFFRSFLFSLKSEYNRITFHGILPFMFSLFIGIVFFV